MEYDEFLKIAEKYMQRFIEIDNRISSAFRELRSKHKITLKELSEATDIPASTLSMYEQGKRNPNKTNMEKIINFYNDYEVKDGI